jgi:hypothetical protein
MRLGWPTRCEATTPRVIRIGYRNFRWPCSRYIREFRSHKTYLGWQNQGLAVLSRSTKSGFAMNNRPTALPSASLASASLSGV